MSDLISLADLPTGAPKTIPTNVSWLDRVTSGGLPPSGRVIIHGCKGSGKVQLAAKIAMNSRFRSVYWYSIGSVDLAREAMSRFRLRDDADICLRVFGDASDLAVQIERYKPDLVVVDGLHLAIGDNPSKPRSFVCRDLVHRAFADVRGFSNSCAAIVLLESDEINRLAVYSGHEADIVIETPTANTAKIAKNRFGTMSLEDAYLI